MSSSAELSAATTRQRNFNRIINYKRIMDKASLIPKNANNAPPKLSRRDAVGFFFAGLSNNMSYVIMIAGAKSISPSMVGLVYVCNVVPSFAVKLTGPYWFHLVPYKDRIFYAALLMATSFVVVAVGQMENWMWLQLIGVAIGSAQSGFGEASYLSLTSFYDSRAALTAWSSGTGFAGILGYGWVVMFTVGLGFSFQLTVLVALILPVLFWANYTFVLTPPYVQREADEAAADQLNSNSNYDSEDRKINAFPESEHDAISAPHSDGEKSGSECGISLPANSDSNSTTNTSSEEDASSAHKLSSKERFWHTISLWPYMVPLFAVYFAEYAMQSGVWAAIGFPVSSKSARAEFYEYSNWTYQCGVLVSRSSGLIYHADIKALWLMPFLQLCLLVFFILDAYFEWWYDWSLLSLCFVVGLFGGAVYVGAYALIADTVPKHMKEFSLSAASLSDGIGIGLSNIAGIFIQRALYKYHGISDN